MHARNSEHGGRVHHAIIRHPQTSFGHLAPGSPATAFAYENQGHCHKPGFRNVQAAIILPRLTECEENSLHARSMVRDCHYVEA